MENRKSAYLIILFFFFFRYKSVEKIEKSHKLKKKFEKEEVNVLPDVVGN